MIDHALNDIQRAAHDTIGGSEALKGRAYDGNVADPSPGGVVMEAISGARCEDGFAAGVFPCHKVDLDAFVPLTDLDLTLVSDMFVLEGLLCQVNYTAGLTISDAWKADQGRLTQRGYFDTFPVDDRTDFFGAWGAYPFFRDGKVVVTSSDEGIFVLDSRAKGPNNEFARGRNR